MKVYSLRRYCPNLEESVTEWFRNRVDAQKRRDELVNSYLELEPQVREHYEWSLSKVSHQVIPEKKDGLIRWLNSNATRS